MKYVEVIFAAAGDRLAQCGRPRRRRKRELNQLRGPLRLPILETDDEGCTPEPVDTLTPPDHRLVDAGS